MRKPEEIAIKITDVSKSFKLPHEKTTSVKSALINVIRTKNTYDKQRVLKDISFEIKKGEFFGIVGRNGSGKSTLLKLMAGIYSPDKGHIQVNGKLTPFIELGVGFNPDLTGRENVFLNGALLGFNRKEMGAMYDEIVKFAELEKFMDQKLKNYSSGMQVRLAFSVAIRTNTDILVLDEVLAVGDEAFQRKCNDYFIKLKKDKTKTIILVTHNMDSVRRYCNKALLLDGGRIITVGDPNEVADSYSKQFIVTSDEVQGEKEAGDHRYGTGEIVYQNIRHNLTKDHLILDFDIANKTKNVYDSITMGFDFCVDGDTITGNDTRYMDKYKNGIELKSHEKKHFTLKFDNNFGNNNFTLVMNITTDMGNNVTDHIRPALEFTSNNVRYHSVFKVLAFPKVIIGDSRNNGTKE